MQEYFSIHSLPFPRVFVAIPSHCLNIPPKAPRAVPRCSKCGRHQHTSFRTPTSVFRLDTNPARLSIYLSIYHIYTHCISYYTYNSYNNMLMLVNAWAPGSDSFRNHPGKSARSLFNLAHCQARINGRGCGGSPLVSLDMG